MLAVEVLCHKILHDDFLSLILGGGNNKHRDDGGRGGMIHDIHTSYCHLLHTVVHFLGYFLLTTNQQLNKVHRWDV